MTKLTSEIKDIEENLPAEKRADYERDMKFGAIMLALNKLEPKEEIYKVGYLFGRHIRISFRWRSRKNLWGRFGGGWNWALGFEIGGTTVLLNLLIFAVMISYRKVPDATR